MARLLFLLLLRAACVPAQTVVGAVLDASTGAGIGGVKVELLKGGTPFYETVTDGGGTFLFDNIKEGDYAARYQSPNYWLTAGPSDYRYFHVAGSDPVKLDVRLMPWSRIAGRVVDNRGNGVANARLELTGPGMVANGRTYLRTAWGGGGGGQLNTAPLQMSFSGTTDARGRFEIQLMPGAYGLSVAPPLDLKPPEPEPGGPALAWKRTFYPGVDLPESASKIVVLPGGEVPDIELRLVAVPSRAVRGVVLNPDGTPAPKVQITLGEMFHRVSVESKPDGTFEFPAVAEGEWPFSAEVQRDSVKLRAMEWIEVPRHDLDNVKLRLAPPLTVRGKLVVEGSKDAPPPRAGPFILSRRGGRTQEERDLGLMEAALANPDAKGDFILQDAYPGAYRLASRLQPAPSPYYLDAARAGAGDLIAQDVELSSDVTITVVYRTDGGSVRGKAEKCASGGVLLVPADPALRRGGLSKSGPCDSTDHYEVSAVRPGEYYALAFAGNGPVLPIDEAILKDAAKVTVRAGEASAVDLRAITKPIY